MTKFHFLLIFTLSIFLFFGCTEDYDEPSINFSGAHFDGETHRVIDFSIEGGNIINLELTMHAEATIDDFKIYRYSFSNGDEVDVRELNISNGWEGWVEYIYSFSKPIEESDFDNDIDKIEFEFEVTDKEGQKASVSYTVSKTVTYTLTFDIVDRFGNEVEDAMITLNDELHTPGLYEFSGLSEGLYEYSVEKTGHVSVEGEINLEADHVESVELKQEERPLSEWYEDIILADEETADFATYEELPNLGTFSNVIGVRTLNFSETEGIMEVTTTENAEGFVVISSIEDLDYYHDLFDVYHDEGSQQITELFLNMESPENNHEPLYFITKTNENYVLVYYKNGVSHPETGNVVVFDYKIPLE